MTGFDYGQYLLCLTARRMDMAVFREPEHPRDLKGRFVGVQKTVKGWHGSSSGRIVGDFKKPTLYIGLDKDLAESYAEGDKESIVHEVEQDAANVLVIDSGEKMKQAWEASGALQVPGPFHPNTTEAFANWARSQGFDAVEIAHEAFDDDIGYEWAGGTFGEPQTLILNPADAKIRPL